MIPHQTAQKMINPYDAPKAPVTASSSRGFSLRNAVVALLAGSILVPASIFAGFRVLFGSHADRAGNLVFWSSILVASVIGAFIAGRLPHLPMFTSAVVGIAVVVAVLILGVVAIAAWAFATGVI